MDEKDFYSLLRHDGRNKAQIVQGYLQLLEDEVSCEGVEYVNGAEKVVGELAEDSGGSIKTNSRKRHKLQRNTFNFLRTMKTFRTMLKNLSKRPTRCLRRGWN